jgi:hypothetical protein
MPSKMMVRLFPPSARCARAQRKRAALAIAVGAKQDDHIFDGDDENERPDNERQDAEDRLLTGRCIWADCRQYRFAQGIERARADVAVDDPDAAESERPEARPRRNLCSRATLGAGDFIVLCHWVERTPPAALAEPGAVLAGVKRSLAYRFPRRGLWAAGNSSTRHRHFARGR